MAYWYPAGVTEADFYDLDGYEPEPTQEEVDALYLDRLEQEAAELPPADFTLELAEPFWTDQKIAEYEAWLAGRDEMPEPKRITVAVLAPAEWEAA